MNFEPEFPVTGDWMSVSPPASRNWPLLTMLEARMVPRPLTMPAAALVSVW